MKSPSDLSTPEVLPHPSLVKHVFESRLRYDSEDIKDPAYRLDAIGEVYARRFEHSDTMYPFLAASLHRVLTQSHQYNHSSLSGRDVERGMGRDNPLITIKGMSIREDFVPGVVPAIRELLAEIRESDLPMRTKLARTAGVAGIATAEAQAFSDGNTRIARTIHDFVAFGPEGVGISGIYSKNRNFLVRPDIEDLIMLQNLSRLLDNDTGLVEPRGAVLVPNDTRELYHETQAYLKDLLELPDFDAKEAGINQSNSTAIMMQQVRAKVALNERIDVLIDLPPGEEKTRVSSTLRQQKYAAAAWTLAFRGENPTLPLGLDSIRRLEEANRSLLLDRVVSLASGIAGGVFPSVEYGGEVRDRSIRKIKWIPSAMWGLKIKGY